MREIEKRLKKLIKNMNDRLYKLQKNKLPSRALDYLKSELPERYQLLHVTKSGYIQFNQSLKNMSFNDMQHYEKILNNFKKAKTSTVSGIKEMYLKGYNTYKKNHMNDSDYLTFEEYSEFWKSGLVQNYSKIFGSDQVVRLSQAMEAEDLSVEELEQILKEGGFNENTQEGEIGLSDMEDLFYLGDDFSFDEL